MSNKKDVITPEHGPSLEPRVEDQIDTLAESLHTTLPQVSPITAQAARTEENRHDQTMAYAGSGSELSEAPSSSQGSFAGMLGRFHYVRVLGEGAFGSVLLVWDPELQTHRAIKVPHRRLIDSKRVDPESYVREARRIAQLGKHPGIVDVLDVQRMDDGMPYVVSEYVPGGSLTDRMKARSMDWQEAVEFVARVAEAIGHAHSKGVVHRDLKPSNILITEKGDPVVADFGLALGDDEFSYQSSVCGTYQYMSPQQVRGEADRVDGRADIFSLGVILYQLLAGRLPYKSRDVASLKREILEDDPTPLRQYNQDLPADLEDICRRALAKDLSERYSTAGDFAAALRRLLAAERSVPAAAPAGAGSGSKSTWLPYVVGAAALGALALFFIARQSPEEDNDNSTTGGTLAVELVAPDLEINLQKANEDGTFRGLMTAADLPLEVGDRLQFHVDLPKPQFAYIYWIDFRGDALRYWPRPDADLSQQRPLLELWSPDQADAGSDAQWWSAEETGGPEVVFVGVSDKMLGPEELAQVESRLNFMTNELGDRRVLEEIKYPERLGDYVREGGATYVVRGGGKVPVVSPKTFATDHTELVKYFSAYHAWVFQTEDVTDDPSNSRRETRRRANRRIDSRDSSSLSGRERGNRRADQAERID
jgi:hypothetical protein